MRFLLSLVFVFLGLTSVSAQETKVFRIEIVNFGIYSGTVTKHDELAGTAGGINTVVDRKLIRQTQTIPARLGTRFGIEYVLRGSPSGTNVPLIAVTRFPPAGMVNPNGQKFDKSQFQTTATIGNRGIRTYAFDNTWELVPGRWTLEFYYGDRKIGEKIFNVVAQ